MQMDIIISKSAIRVFICSSCLDESIKLTDSHLLKEGLF